MRALMRSSWPVASNQPAQVTFLGILNLLELLRTYVFKFMYIYIFTMPWEPTCTLFGTNSPIHLSLLESLTSDAILAFLARLQARAFSA